MAKEINAFKLEDLVKAKDTVIEDITFTFDEGKDVFYLPSDSELNYPRTEVEDSHQWVIYTTDELGIFQQLYHVPIKGEESLTPEEDHAELKKQHSKRRKDDFKHKQRVHEELANKSKEDAELYQDNPTKYFAKKAKKTKQIRQQKQHLAKKRERREVKEELSDWVE